MKFLHITGTALIRCFVLGSLVLALGCNRSEKDTEAEEAGTEEATEARREAADRDAAASDRDAAPPDSVLRPGYVDHSKLSEEESMKRVMSGMGFSAVGEGVRLILSEDILFDQGKADIKPESQKTLEDLRDVIVYYPEAPVKINGYSDNQEAAGKNLALRRATAVRDYMVKNFQVPQNRFTVQGLGSGGTQAGQQRNQQQAGADAQNRRVEVIIVTSGAAEEGATAPGR